MKGVSERAKRMSGWHACVYVRQADGVSWMGVNVIMKKKKKNIEEGAYLSDAS